VPLIFTVYFLLRGETSGTAFSAFWFGENFLYISVYISDARAMALPLVGGGEHDWNAILGDLHLLQQDTTIGDVVRLLGWAIMVGRSPGSSPRGTGPRPGGKRTRLSRPPGRRYE